MKTVYYIFRRLCLGVEPYTPSRAFFDGDEDLVALLHDCIPLLSKIQFFFALPLQRRRSKSDGHVTELAVVPVRCRLKRAKFNPRLKVD